MHFILESAFKSDMTLRMIPNHGIIQSIKNVPLLLVLATSLSTAIFCMLGLLSSKNFSGLFTYVLLGLTISPFLLIFSEASLPVFQHFSLRIILSSSDKVPWKYARFLNHCSERRLLQKVGGRYRFIHRLVQEHFAAMPLERGRGVDG